MDTMQQIGCLVTSGDSSCSGVILNNYYVLTHSTILRTHLLKNLKTIDDLTASRYIPSVPINVTVFGPQQKTATIEVIWNAKKFAETNKKLLPKTEGWKFKDDSITTDNVDYNIESETTKNDILDEKLTPEQIDVLTQMIPYFVLLKLDSPLQVRSFRDITVVKDIRVGQNVFIVCTPFGSICPSVFYNSVSSGIVSQCVDDALILTDAKCAPATEGAPVFVKHGKCVSILGMVVAPLFWKKSEWLGLSVVCAMADILDSLLQSKTSRVKELLPKFSKHFVHPLTLEYRYSPQISTYTGTIQADCLQLLNLNEQMKCTVLVQATGNWGTGVIIDRQEGFVVTCAHVVRECNEVRLRLHNNMWCQAAVIYKTETVDDNIVYDVALLKIKASDRLMKTVPKVNPSTPVKGMHATVIGHTPFGGEHVLKPLVSYGIVSQVIYRDMLPVLVQSTCTVQAGASGGPVFDNNGQLLGIVTSNAKDSVTGATYPHINLIVPAITFWPWLEKYIQTKDVSTLNNLHIKAKHIRHLWMLKSNQTLCEHPVVKRSKL